MTEADKSTQGLRRRKKRVRQTEWEGHRKEWKDKKPRGERVQQMVKSGPKWEKKTKWAGSGKKAHTIYTTLS